MAPTSAAEPSSMMKESPNWLEIPDDLMVNIFQRLPTIQVLKSTRKVCTTWGRICKYPAVWKVINMLKEPVDDWGWDCDLEALTKEAVDLSCGELIDISIEGFGTHELFDHIVLHSNKLKRLCLVSCGNITDSVSSLAVKTVPHLEELHLLDTCINAHDLEASGRNCPQLKSLKMNKISRGTYDDHAYAIADSMPELHHLELSYHEMTTNGLESILNGCPHLESLYLHGCRNLDFHGYFENLCEERVKDFKHDNAHRMFCDYNGGSDMYEEEIYDEFLEGDFYVD